MSPRLRTPAPARGTSNGAVIGIAWCGRSCCSYAMSCPPVNKEYPMADDAKDEQAAQVAEQEAQIAAAKPSRAQTADVADDAPDTEPADRAPRVWLAYDPKSGKRYNHIPTQGSGAGGELTPDEVQAYFTRAEYDQATKQDKTYVRARKTDLRATTPYEVTANGE